MAAHLITGIDVGTTKICTLIAEVFEDRNYQILGVGIEPSRGMKKGVVVNVEEASAAIQASVLNAERSAGVEIDRGLVSMAGAHVSSVNSNGVVGISDTQWGIDETDIERALNAAEAIAIPYGREKIHVIPRNFTVDGQEGIRSPLGMHGFRLEVEAHIVTASTTSIQNLEKCVENAGPMIESFVLNPIASGETVLNDTERDMGVVICDIGGGTTDLAIYIDGQVWHTMVLPVGGNHVTSDVAHGLRMPQDMAEQIKLEYGHASARDVDASETFRVMPFGAEHPQQVSRKDLAMIIEARIEEIFSLVMQEIKRSGYDGLLPAGIVITGGTANLPGIRQVANRVLNLPARVAGPRDIHGLTDQVENRPEYATSVGLIIWAANHIDDQGGYAGRDPRRQRKPGGRWNWLSRLGRITKPFMPDAD